MTIHRHLLALLATAALLSGCPSQTHQTEPDEPPTDSTGMGERELRYRVALDDEQPETLLVHLAFVGDGSRETTIVPPEAPLQPPESGEKLALESTTDAATVAEKTDKGFYRVEHEPGAEVRLVYRVRGANDPTESTNRFGPFVGNDGIYFQGSTLFAHPRAMHPGLQRPITIDWRPLPNTWTIIGGRRETDPLQKRQTALGVIQNSMFMAGNLQIAERSIGESTLTLAMLGQLPSPVSSLADQAAALIRTQHTFWGNSDPEPYLIALYGSEDCCWSTATTRYKALAGIIAHKQRKPTAQQLAKLVAHQHLHRWIPGAMGTPRPFNAYAWFAEGFTEFYARRFKVETGFDDFRTYLEQTNQLLARYHASPVRTATRTQVNGGFKRNPNLTQLAYQRGELLALNWHAAIRQATDGKHTLADVMRRLVQRRRADEEFYFSDETFAATLHEFAPSVEVVPVIERHIGRGKPIEIHPEALGSCARFVEGDDNQPPRFELAEYAEQTQACLVGP